MSDDSEWWGWIVLRDPYAGETRRVLSEDGRAFTQALEAIVDDWVLAQEDRMGIVRWDPNADEHVKVLRAALNPPNGG